MAGMKLGFKFSNLCGTVYRGGNVVFTPDGYSLLSAVGNRVTVFDLQHHTSHTLPFEARRNITVLALSNNGRLLITVDEDGRALLINFKKHVVLHRFNFKKAVTCLVFSPCDEFFAVSHGTHVQVWRSPGLHKQFNPFIRLRTYTGHHMDVTCINWSSDSQHFVAGSQDMTVRIYSRDPIEGFRPITLSGHRDLVKGCFFADGDGSGESRDDLLGNSTRKSGQDQILYTISRDGAVFVWKWQEFEAVANDNEEGIEAVTKMFNEKALKKPRVMRRKEGDEGGVQGQWLLMKKEFIQIDHCKIDSVALNRQNNLLVVGFSSGIFGLYDMPSCTQVHTLSISQRRITASAINSTGEWLAFGSEKLGQLLVWEWQSETYVLKQQGHYSVVNSMAYSPDGQLFVTGGDDGKIKLWNASSGFCFVTFTEHTSPITDLAFVDNGHAVISCSLDGTVRAFDLVRYRNFRTFITPQPVQFLSCAVDSSGDIVVAGSMEPFEIYVWSMQTGRLLDVLCGHSAPVTSLAFSPTHPVLASGSWDKTVRLWDVFKASTAPETFTQESDVLSIAWRPDGKQLCAATLKGTIALWDPDTGKQEGTIDGRTDIAGGRLASSRRSAMDSAQGKCFTSIAYSADGGCIVAGGRSKYLCLYEATQGVLLKKWQLSHNRSLDGVLDKLNSGRLTEAGAELGDMNIGESDEEDARNDALPGAKHGPDASTRQKRVEVMSKCVRFSPTGRSIGVATSEGVMIYSLDDRTAFTPFELDIDVTPDSIRGTVAEGLYTKALLMSLHLNESEDVLFVLRSTPFDNIPLVARSLPKQYLPKVLPFIAKYLSESPHLEFLLVWCSSILRGHGQALRDHKKNPMRFMTSSKNGGYTPSSGILPMFRTLQKAIKKHLDELGVVCDENLYSLEYIANAPPLRTPTFTDACAKEAENFVPVSNKGNKRSLEEIDSNVMVLPSEDESNASEGEWATCEQNNTGMAGFPEEEPNWE